MDSAVKRGLSHPYARQPFNPLETRAAATHFDPVLIVISICLIVLWWRSTLGSGSYLANHVEEYRENRDVEMEGYGSTTGFRQNSA
mmetsp:Transcript_42991/g.67416  ORF Transcript_42991/g.67416 Transcript_42991/m.67416 type:complete len:86 (-) Transcript_42991:186-443(-)